MFYTLKNIDETAKFLIIVPSITLVTQMYDNFLEYYYGQNNIESTDYYIEVEKENGEILKLKPDDDILTINRGVIKAIDLKKNDEI
jgi:hypothetical protein